MMSSKNSLENFLYITVGILLFVFAIELLTSSAGGMVPEIKDLLVLIDNSFNALGLGWIASYVMLSGYPVTVFGLTLFDSGIINGLMTFFIINGSRLGASLIIIIIGLVEALKNKNIDMVDSTSLGFLSLMITYMIVLPAIIIGLIIVRLGIFTVSFEIGFLSIIDVIYSPVVNPVLSFLGPFKGLILAILSLYLALSIFEKPFHRIKIENFKSSWINFLMEHKIYSFLFGAVLTFFSQSVALSIGLIVPLYNRGFLQRRNLIPYIMGACVTTFGGTLAVAFLIGNHSAVNITLAVILANFLVCMFYMAFYDSFYEYISSLVNFFLMDEWRLLILVISMFLIPFMMIFISF